MGEPEAKAAARAAIKAGMDAAYGGGTDKYDEFAGSVEQAFWDAFVAAGGGGGGGGTKKILYGAQYSSTSSSIGFGFTYFVSFFDYSYFYSNANYDYEAVKNMPIPGPGNIVRVFAKTSQAIYSTTAACLFQLRKNNADVVGASFTVPNGAPADTIYDVTGSWPFADGDEMCMQADLQASGTCYVRAVGLVVEV